MFFSGQCAISSSTKRRWMYLCSPSRPHTLTLEVVKEVNSSSSCLLVYWKIAGIPDKTSHFYGCDQRYEWLGSSYTAQESPYNLTYYWWHKIFIMSCGAKSRAGNQTWVVLNVWLQFEFSNKQAGWKDPARLYICTLINNFE